MTDEEIKQKFKEVYPEYMYGDTPLSPYYDIWCYAIELMENQMEKMECCHNCEIFTHHNVADCGEPVLIDKSHGTYVCDKWKLREKWDDRNNV